MTVPRIRPSAASRVVACAGSVQICADAPTYMDEDGDNTVREEGTACHWLAHQLATSSADPGPVAGNGVPITPDMHDGAKLYLDAVEAWGADRVYFEHPINIPDIPDCAGTPDAFALTTHADGLPLVNVGDLKFGYRVVNVWPNYQLIAYGSGVARLFGFDPAGVWYRFMIVQPRRWHQHGRIRTAIMHGSQVLPYLQKLQLAAYASTLPNAPLTTGPHCDYCVGRARCPATRDAAYAVTLPGVAHDLALPDAERELQYLRKHRAVLDAYVSGLEAQVEHGLRKGATSTRFELARKAGRRVWITGQEGKLSALAKLMGAQVEKPPELITPTQALEVLPAEIVNMFSTRAPGALTLAEQDASRWDAIFNRK